jgi:hypothetical protein
LDFVRKTISDTKKIFNLNNEENDNNEKENKNFVNIDLFENNAFENKTYNLNNEIIDSRENELILLDHEKDNNNNNNNYIDFKSNINKDMNNISN